MGCRLHPGVNPPANCSLRHCTRLGRPAYAIPPMAVAQYRGRHSVARKKPDHIEVLTLANILRTDARAHRRLPAIATSRDLARTTAVLARAAQDAIWRFTRANQELQAWSIGARRDRSFTFCPSPTESGWVVGVSAANTHDTALMQAMVTAIPAVGSRRGPWRRNPASFAATRSSTAPSSVGG